MCCHFSGDKGSASTAAKGASSKGKSKKGKGKGKKAEEEAVNTDAEKEAEKEEGAAVKKEDTDCELWSDGVTLCDYFFRMFEERCLN